MAFQNQEAHDALQPTTPGESSSDAPVVHEAPGAPGVDPHAGHDMSAATAGETHEGTEHAEGHGSGGLPQFDFAWWPGQILWFLIIFGLVLVFIRVFAAPKVGNTIEQREGHIAGQIAEARRMKEEADRKAEAAQAEIAAARASAQKVAAEARAKANAEAAARLAEEEGKLAAQSAEAEARIGTARDAAMGNVAGIAAETAEAIVAKLTGRPATAAELASARG
jgi:F-type H+-transporting ATPase subunit b